MVVERQLASDTHKIQLMAPLAIGSFLHSGICACSCVDVHFLSLYNKVTPPPPHAHTHTHSLHTHTFFTQTSGTHNLLFIVGATAVGGGQGGSALLQVPGLGAMFRR